MREQRFGADFFYFGHGDMAYLAAEAFAGAVYDLVRSHGGGNMRLAVDKIMMVGPKALESKGLTCLRAKS